MDNLNQWIDDRQSFERARHPQKKKKLLPSGQECQLHTCKQPCSVRQVAPLSTSHLLLGSPTPMDWNFSERLISSARCCSLQTLSVLELEAATVTGFPRTHMVIWLIWLTDPSLRFPHLHSLHPAPHLLLRLQHFETCFLFLPLVFLPPFPLPLPLPPGLVGWPFGLAAGFFSGCFSQQSFAKWPFLPQWLHFLGSGQFSARWSFFPQLKHVLSFKDLQIRFCRHRLGNMHWSQVTTESFELFRLIPKEFSLMSRTEALSCRGMCLKFRVKRTEHLLDIIREVESRLNPFMQCLRQRMLKTSLVHFPSASSAYSLPIVIQGPEHKDLSLLHSLHSLQVLNLQSTSLWPEYAWECTAPLISASGCLNDKCQCSPNAGRPDLSIVCFSTMETVISLEYNELVRDCEFEMVSKIQDFLDGELMIGN